MEQITVHELKAKLDNKEKFILLDVREPEEFEMCHIQGSILIPLSEFEDHLKDFKKDGVYIVHCKSGERSVEAIQMMQDHGFENCTTVEGGILEWADSIERHMEKY